MGPTNNIGFLLQHVAFMLGRQSDQVLQEKLGIGLSQFKILMVLKWNPSIQQKEIADHLGQTEASVSRQIKLLQDKGLLETTVSPKNRRQHIATLTKLGLNMADAAPRVLREYHAPTMGCLSDSQQAKLLDLLQMLHVAACSRQNGGCLKETSMAQAKNK